MQFPDLQDCMKYLSHGGFQLIYAWFIMSDNLCDHYLNHMCGISVNIGLKTIKSSLKR